MKNIILLCCLMLFGFKPFAQQNHYLQKNKKDTLELTQEQKIMIDTVNAILNKKLIRIAKEIPTEQKKTLSNKAFAEQEKQIVAILNKRQLFLYNELKKKYETEMKARLDQKRKEQFFKYTPNKNK